ncbi:MAG: hypothetical protein ABW156_08985 [Jiangellaceae bacterium]
MAAALLWNARDLVAAGLMERAINASCVTLGLAVVAAALLLTAGRVALG